MNNTRKTIDLSAIGAIKIAAILVVGGAGLFVTTSTAFAADNKNNSSPV